MGDETEMSLRLRRKPTRQERAMRIVRVAQTEIPAIYRDTDFSKVAEYRDMAMEYQNWLRKNPPAWVPGVRRSGWRSYARDISGDTSRLSFVAGLLLGIAIGIVVALAMTVRPRNRQAEEVDLIAMELIPDAEMTEELDSEDAADDAAESEETAEVSQEPTKEAVSAN